MILVITKENLEITSALKLNNIEQIHAPGNLNVQAGNSATLNDGLILFQCEASPIHCKVGLNWIFTKYKSIDFILFIGFLRPINNSILRNQVVIPTEFLNLDEPPVEWSQGVNLENISSSQESQKILRSGIHENNLDFSYCRILSYNQQYLNKNIVLELNDYKIGDAINNLSFSINKYALINKVPILNLLIRSQKKHSQKTQNIVKQLLSKVKIPGKVHG